MKLVKVTFVQRQKEQMAKLGFKLATPGLTACVIIERATGAKFEFSMTSHTEEDVLPLYHRGRNIDHIDIIVLSL